MTRQLYLFDDRIARSWEPFALTRPIGELLYGALLLRERAERSVGLRAAGHLGAPALEGFTEEGAPPVRARGEHSEDEETLLLSSRYVPPLPGEDADGNEGPTLTLPPESPPDGLVLTARDGTAVGRLLPAGHPPPSPDELDDPTAWRAGSGSGSSSGAAGLEVPGRVLESPWQLMTESPDRLARDLARLHPGGSSADARPLSDLPGVHRVGEHPVSAGEGVVVDPSVVLDTRGGPIHLSDDVHVHSFTDLRGPAFIGRGSALLGGVFEAVTCGPVCKLRGEVDTSVVLGYSNKAHDGYLGHSLVGRWVNLGALTTNSDLKNNYGSIRVATEAGEVDTGLMKVGVFLGDHVKTGIGTLLNGGTLLGAGANVFGGALPGKWVPPFGWGSGDRFVPFRLDAFLATAERAMGRRGIRLTEGVRGLFTRAWETTHGPPPEEGER